MVVKQSEPVRPVVPVLNGRQAELADPDYQSEDEEEEDAKSKLKKSSQHKFSQPDNMKFILESECVQTFLKIMNNYCHLSKLVCVA